MIHQKTSKKVSMRQDFNYASIDIGNVANEGLLQYPDLERTKAKHARWGHLDSLD